jgi:hypothetical protein
MLEQKKRTADDEETKRQSVLERKSKVQSNLSDIISFV